MSKRLPYNLACLQILSLYEGWKDKDFCPAYAEYLTIPIKEILFCTPAIPTGFVSETASQLPYSKITRDHYFSRTRTARRILELMRKGILSKKNLPRFEAFLKSRSRVHYITPEENRRMIRTSQTVRHWKFEYEEAGIKLIKYEKGKSI